MIKKKLLCRVSLLCLILDRKYKEIKKKKEKQHKITIV